MSEYQYYEFLAIDRPLDEDEQADVRALSTRAEITATGFTNEYEWGDFKGDPDTLMSQYYDAHLYWANWGTHRLMLRLPKDLLPPRVAREYAVDEHVIVRTTGDHVVLDFHSEDEEGEWEEDAVPGLASLVGVRAELAAGDLRPLYLAWLAAYGGWERDEDAFGDDAEDTPEPPVPAGLDSPTAAQRALADFLRLDGTLLGVAARASAPPPGDAALNRHIGRLPVKEKDGLLLKLAQGQAAEARFELLNGLRGETGTEPAERRTVGDLLDAATEAR
ncbi:hypothetical protein [Actinomadura sp. WMMB 499]|uniref:hypothetical protein n=1 Tax=Actinomadura sp. WMMB 499 TaxID=1219491 RepID=UPI0012444F8F|nr:hypothetical protein [Actinomadura sp. WMMB 499]QFG20431.1 hypothetical protein F7P10_03890 [Actinomadura sp. WMMB 499]